MTDPRPPEDFASTTSPGVQGGAPIPGRPGPVRGLARAAALRCPHCGEGSLLIHWLELREQCGRCGLRFDRGESDHFLGAMMFNLIASEAALVLVVLLTILGTWPNPPWTALTLAGPVLMLVAPFIFCPFSKAIWLACDLIFRPPVATEDRTQADPAGGCRPRGTAPQR